MTKEVIARKLSEVRDSRIVLSGDSAKPSTFGSAAVLPNSRLPQQLQWFKQQYKEILLYSNVKPYPRNGWIFGELREWPDNTVNENRGSDPDEYPYFENVWEIAHYAMDGGELITVDLNKGPRFGWIGWVTQTDIDYGGGSIAIATSFFEWLDRTVERGPIAEEPYWRLPGFKDYGPVIPNDPYYEVR